MAALAIKLQSVWMIYIAQILFVPAFILLLFIIPIIFLLGVWIYFTIGEKYDDYKVRRRYSH
jgi:membrane protein YdbS with pleckstrin-like domain